MVQLNTIVTTAFLNRIGNLNKIATKTTVKGCYNWIKL